MRSTLPYWTILLLGLLASSPRALWSAAAALVLLASFLLWGARKGG